MSEQQSPEGQAETETSAQDGAQEASADMRRALLDAGRTEFANYGYDGARLERIVAKVGCAKRMLYYYFGNKKDVYLAVIEQSYLDIRDSEEQLNLDGLQPLEALHALGRPLLVGVSRKSMVGQTLNRPVAERLYGSLALAALAMTKGARILRVHDVAETVDVVRMIAAVDSAD